MDVSYELRELNEEKELRKFVGVEDMPDVDSFYRFMSRFSENQFVKLVNGVLNIPNPSKGIEQPLFWWIVLICR